MCRNTIKTMRLIKKTKRDRMEEVNIATTKCAQPLTAPSEQSLTNIKDFEENEKFLRAYIK